MKAETYQNWRLETDPLEFSLPCFGWPTLVTNFLDES